MTNYGAGSPNTRRHSWPSRESILNPSSGLLRPQGRPHHPGGRIHEGFGCSPTTERKTCHLHIKNIDTSRDRLLQHWKGATQHHIWIGWVTSLHLWQQCWGTDWPQAIDTNQEEVNCGSQPSISMTIALTSEVWHRTDISERQRQCYHWCPQPCQPLGTCGSRQRWLWCNTSLPHHGRSLSNGERGRVEI